MNEHLDLKTTIENALAILLGFFGVSGTGFTIHQIITHRAAIWNVVKRFVKAFANTFADKRKTEEYPVTNGNGNGSSIRLAATNLESVNELIRELRRDVDDLKSDKEITLESLKALEKQHQEMQEFWRKELRDFKTQQTIDTGRAISRRSSEIENEVAKQAEQTKIAQLDMQGWGSAITSSIDIMQKAVTTSLDSQQESFNEMIDLFKEFVKRVQPAQPEPPSALELSINDDTLEGARLLSEAKRETSELKPTEIKPDTFKPAKPEDSLPGDAA